MPGQFEGSLSADKLRSALSRVQRRHPALRASSEESDGLYYEDDCAPADSSYTSQRRLRRSEARMRDGTDHRSSPMTISTACSSAAIGGEGRSTSLPHHIVSAMARAYSFLSKKYCNRFTVMENWSLMRTHQDAGYYRRLPTSAEVEALFEGECRMACRARFQVHRKNARRWNTGGRRTRHCCMHCANAARRDCLPHAVWSPRWRFVRRSRKETAEAYRQSDRSAKREFLHTQ